MKRILFAVLLAAALPVLAQTANKASGMVTRVDALKNKVVIKHGPVPSLNWPGMTMAFTVKDKALMDKLAKDKKVDFEFVEQGNDYVITSVK